MGSLRFAEINFLTGFYGFALRTTTHSEHALIVRVKEQILKFCQKNLFKSGSSWIP